MTGTEMNRIIREMLDELGLIGWHHPDSRMAEPSSKGWPDWVIVGKRIIYRECKGTYDTLKPAQRRIGRAIYHAGGDWAVWGPGDLYPLGRARKELESIA